LGKRYVLFAALLFLISSLHAQEEESAILETYQSVDGLNQWQKTLPLEGLKDGTYNLILRGRDAAGNAVESPAVDIQIDQDSDRPRSSISYPSPFLRISGNLTVLGSAVDDDQVDRVEVRLGEGDFILAEGQEYWSHSFDTKSLKDGLHTITVRSIDIKGIEGPETKRSFYLDRSAPEIIVASHRNGDLVSRKFQLEGSISDDNGLAEFWVSRDNGSTWEAEKLKGNIKQGEATFRVSVDSRILEDGPNVLRLRSRDLQGSEGETALLVYVDNTPPKLEILYPREDKPENGKFLVGGRASDDIGIAGLKWAYKGADWVEIPVYPGDPFWSAEVDFVGEDQMVLNFELTDIAGNISSVSLKRELNLEGDKPRIQLAPRQDSHKVIKGWILDDDASKGIIYRLDKGDEISLETGRSFAIDLKDLSAGEHRLAIQGVDIFDFPGDVEEQEFFLAPEEPEILFSSDYTPKVEFDQTTTATLSGRVIFDSGRGMLEVIYPGREAGEQVKLEKTEDPQLFRWTIDLPGDLPLGYVPVTLKASDELGAVKEDSAYFWNRNLTRIQEDFGLYKDKRSQVILGRREGYDLYFHGHPLAEASLERAIPGMDVVIEGNRVRLIPQSPLLEPQGNNVRVVTDRGTEFIQGLPEIIADFDPPVLSLEGEVSQVARGAYELIGEYSDDLGISALRYRLNGGEWTSLGIQGQEKAGTFSHRISPGDFEQGLTLIQVQVEDFSGKKASAYRAIAPQVTWGEEAKADLVGQIPGESIAPEDMSSDLMAGAWVQVLDPSEVTSVSYAINNGEPQSINSWSRTFPVIPLPLGALDPGKQTIRITLSYGENKTLKEDISFQVLPEGNTLTLVDYSAGLSVTGGEDTFLSGFITGARSMESLAVQWNSGESLPVKTSKTEEGLSFTLPLEDLDWGRQDFTLLGMDEYGDNLAFTGFVYVLADPAGRRIDDKTAIYPLGYQGGEYWFAFNGRGISQLTFTEDQPYLRLEEKGDNRFVLTSTQAYQGEDIQFSLSTIDGESFTYPQRDYSFDSEPPQLRVTQPEGNQYFSQFLPLEGFVGDNWEVSTLEYSLNQGSWLSGDWEILEGQFATEISLEGLEDGPATIRLRAIDPSGNEEVWEELFIKDSQPPGFEQILPQGQEEINGAVTMVVRSFDDWGETIKSDFSLGEEVVALPSYNGFYRISSDFSPYEELPEVFEITGIDNGGNTGDFRPVVNFKPESDKPQVEVQFPESNALFTKEAVFSGIVLDDDGISGISYQLDQQDPVEIPGGNSFEITLPFHQLEDNEHTITIWATDLEGVASDPVVLPFRVSQENPVASMVKPELGTTNKGIVLLEGIVEDKNGIDRVELSFDNGLTFKKADLVPLEEEKTEPLPQEEGEADEGVTEEGDPPAPKDNPVPLRKWQYQLDTQVLVDGTYMILIRGYDSYGQSSLFSDLLTLDNTPPRLEASLPMDGVSIMDKLPLQLRLGDEIAVETLEYQIRSIEEESEEREGVEVLTGEVTVNDVVLQELDVTNLEPGLYNLTLLLKDGAQNETIVSRDFIKRDPLDLSEPKILYPLKGSRLQGPFTIQGRVEGDYLPESATITVNGGDFDVVEVDEFGYFTLRITPDQVPQGELLLGSAINIPGKERRLSKPINIDYTKEGAWLQILSVNNGDYVSQRPWIKGTAGFFSLTPEMDKELPKEVRKSRQVKRVEYSLDNGKSFYPAKGREEWKFRLETQDLYDGQLSLLVRSHFRGGYTAQDQITVFVDDTPPSLTILTPEEGLSLNEEIHVTGTAFDENGLSDMEIMLRPRSKNSYEVPQFIQGLYLDFHALGGTSWEAGVGLTFFDNNVKLQGIIGEAPQGRFNGMVYGAKLLANVAAFPYGYYFGPDWDWLSSSIAVGASFQYFTMENSQFEQEGLVLGSTVLQLELAKITFSQRKMFKGISVYAENQLWFISSDIEGGAEYRLAFGLRTNVF